MKNTVWILIFCGICAVCAAIYFLIGTDAQNAEAVITLGGEIVKTVDLASIDEPYEFEIRTDDGSYNKIRAEKGKIAVIEADCRDKICVNQGYVEKANVPIICLPHKLSIVIKEKDAEADAVTGGG